MSLAGGVSFQFRVDTLPLITVFLALQFYYSRSQGDTSLRHDDLIDTWTFDDANVHTVTHCFCRVGGRSAVWNLQSAYQYLARSPLSVRRYKTIGRVFQVIYGYICWNLTV